jgi:hypothetical protein
MSEMRIAVQEEWNKLQPSDWKQFIDSMPGRIRDLKDRKGMQIQN